jgi:preprotein translocase subunit SecA
LRDVGGDASQIDFEAIARKRTHHLELMVLLRSVDDRWIEHLYEMDYLRESVRLRAFGQRDPLLEYKQEGFEMFQNLVRNVEENVIQTLYRLTDPEFRSKREQSIKQGTLTVKEDPFTQLQHYSYIAADKQADFDTGRFQLGGGVPVSDDNGAPAKSDGEGNGKKQQSPQQKPKPQPVRAAQKVGPNEPCPCGSGKKYKKCCGNQAS